MRPPSLGSSARTLFAGSNVQCVEFHIAAGPAAAAAPATATATTVSAGGESTGFPGSREGVATHTEVSQHLQLLVMPSRYRTGIATNWTSLEGGDEQILATERGVIPCCTQKKRRSDAAGPALCYQVVNRRSPSTVLHHLLVSGCIIPRPPARWDPSLITTPSSCSIPSPSSHSRCRLLPHLDLSVSSGASLRHRRLRLRAWAVRRNFRACVLSRQARRSCCLDACG